VALGLELR